MKPVLTLLFLFAVSSFAIGQTYWDPDSTAYNYLSRGDNLSQWAASAGTKVELDRSTFVTAGSSIKWTIPANHGPAILELNVIDVDLHDRVVYMRCRRNNHPALIEAKLITSANKGYHLAAPIVYNDNGFHLAVDAWHQTGQSSWVKSFGGAVFDDLRHVSKLVFSANDAAVEQILWIDEIKHIRPRGPVCVIHFNHYRDSADSLVTPWLIQKGYRANIDFTYDLAERRVIENRANAGLIVRYIGLERIAELVNKHGWSASHHGAIYKDLRKLTLDERMQVYSLEPFVKAGFATQWYFSVPMDWTTPEILAEIQALNRFRAVRNQWDKSPNELPIDTPMRTGFYRLTSASAGPNLSKTETLAEMRQRVSQFYRRKGLMVLAIESVVTAPSPDYKGVEFSTLSDDQAVIQYADSLGFKFMTFEELFKPDPNYQQQVSINNDYTPATPGRGDTVAVLQNDLFPVNRSLRLESVSAPQHGQAQITDDQQAIVYIADSNYTGSDRFTYRATDGILSDSATVFVAVGSGTGVDGDGGSPHGFTLAQNFPNPFNPATTIRYTLSAPSQVRLEVFDIGGRRVATLVNGLQNAGAQAVLYYAANIPSGLYFYKLTAGSFVETKKMVIMK
ncbi:MAG: hypothetical protein ALAOOOJD_00310 [bacterium]|nr:hypothetical protein [bacterium]